MGERDGVRERKRQGKFLAKKEESERKRMGEIEEVRERKREGEVPNKKGRKEARQRREEFTCKL